MANVANWRVTVVLLYGWVVDEMMIDEIMFDELWCINNVLLIMMYKWCLMNYDDKWC